ncbi:alpha/beta hydrolase, partial [Burkholderia pseudomallei]
MRTALPPLPAADETALPAASSFYGAPLVLATSHAQSIVPALFARRPDVAY